MASVTTPLRGRTFLVVDDDEGIRFALAALLSAAGAEVVSAPDGARAARGLRERAADVDLVLLDLSLPDKPPEAVFRELRSLVPDIPILISSGRDEVEVAGLCEGLDAAGFLHKPYRFHQLVEAVNSALATTRGRG